MFTCTICQRQFKTKGSLFTHRSKFHPKPSNSEVDQNDVEESQQMKLFASGPPVIERFTAFCIKNVFFENVLSNRAEAQQMFSIEQLLFMDAVQRNENLDESCRLLEENLNILLRIIIYVCNK